METPTNTMQQAKAVTRCTYDNTDTSLKHHVEQKKKNSKTIEYITKIKSFNPPNNLMI